MREACLNVLRFVATVPPGVRGGFWLSGDASRIGSSGSGPVTSDGTHVYSRGGFRGTGFLTAESSIRLLLLSSRLLQPMQ
jgi:hypothetical protein